MKVNLNVHQLKNIANAMDKLTKNNNRFHNAIFEMLEDDKVKIVFTNGSCLYEYILDNETYNNLPDNYVKAIPDILETDINLKVTVIELTNVLKRVKHLKPKYITLYSDNVYLYIKTDKYNEKIKLMEETEKTMKKIDVNIDYMLNFLKSCSYPIINIKVKENTVNQPLILVNDDLTNKAIIMPIVKS